MKKKEVLLRLGAMAMIAALGIAPVTSGISAMAEMPDVTGAIPSAAIIAIAPNLSNTSFFFIFF